MAGAYESWFLSARDTARPRGLWIRHTRLRPAGGAESPALWCTVFDPDAGPPAAVKESGRGAPAGPAAFRGEARAGGHGAAWAIELTGGEPPLHHLRPAALYRLPVPRTKLESPLPDGIATGRVEVDGRRVPLAGWRATVGRNWGTAHAERWAWIHAADLDDAPEAWLELALARVRVAGAQTPWLATGALAVGGRRLALGGPHRRARVVAAPGLLEARVGGAGVRLAVAVRADLAQTVAFHYADPAGGGHDVLHAGLAEVHLRVRHRRRPALELATAHGGAYELGGVGPHDVPLQPYPDP